MEVVIKKLKPELIEDYLYFFDNIAFTDHEEWSKCYCIFFHMTEEMETINGETGEIKNRDFAIDYINKGLLNGYLAYVDEKPVGWVNTDDKNSFYAINRQNAPEIWEDNEPRIKSVVCFTIAPNLRGRGIATKLLGSVVDDAKKEGYEYLEAYPIIGEHNNFTHYHGPAALYKKFGFKEYKKYNAVRAVWRLKL